jgi:protein-disulfide isomerase
MLIARAVIRTAISIALFGGLMANWAAAQTAANGQPPRPDAQSPASTSASNDAQQNKEQEEIRRELRELKREQAEIRKELSLIKQLLLASQPGKPTLPEKISIASRPTRGSDSARVVVVEFSDYQCPFCAMFFQQTLPQLDQAFIKTGKIRYVFNNVPLDRIHPSAFKAAEAAECAGDQGKFWEMHDKLFSNQKSLSLTELSSHARAIGLDATQFTQCLDSGKNRSSVQAGLDLASVVGVDGTPTFVIALADAQNVKDTDLKIFGIISGAQPFSVFKSALDKALATK